MQPWTGYVTGGEAQVEVSGETTQTAEKIFSSIINMKMPVCCILIEGTK